jgi:hypothetical protein
MPRVGHDELLLYKENGWLSMIQLPWTGHILISDTRYSSSMNNLNLVSKPFNVCPIYATQRLADQ